MRDTGRAIKKEKKEAEIRTKIPRCQEAKEKSSNKPRAASNELRAYPEKEKISSY